MSFSSDNPLPQCGVIFNEKVGHMARSFHLFPTNKVLTDGNCDCHGAVVTIAKYASCQDRRNNPIKRKLDYTMLLRPGHAAGQEFRVGPFQHQLLRAHSLPCHEHDAPIPASESKQHRRDEFHQLRDVPHRQALVDHPRTMLKSSQLVFHPRSSYTISRQYWDSMVVVLRFIFVPLSHSLRRTFPRVRRHGVENVKGLLTVCLHVADKKDLSAPVATEPQAPSR